MRLLPGYEMASNAQPYIVKTAIVCAARTGRGLQKICADLKHWFLFFLSIRKEKRRPPGDSGLCASYKKCRFVNAWPEPDFRYISKSSAFLSLVKLIAKIMRHGRNLDVCGDFPELCSCNRFLISIVIPIYRLPG